MKTIYKVAMMAIALAIGASLPAIAQIQNGMNFTTDFPFYAQNVKLPAGSYRITQQDIDDNKLLLIESIDGKYSAFIDVIPTQAAEPHAQTDVTFHKYGDVDYLNRIWIEGQTYGMKVEPTKAEKKAAVAASAAEHTLTGKKR